MSITRQPPRTIWLGGTANPIIENTLVAGVAITPGHLLLRYVNSGVVSYKPHDAASAAAPAVVALNASMLNHGVDDAYAVGDLVEAQAGQKGDKFWMLLASGQNVAAGAMLESNGDGTLKAGTTHPLFAALESINNSGGLNVPTRIRVEVV